jgi:hypothetical protein
MTQKKLANRSVTPQKKIIHRIPMGVEVGGCNDQLHSGSSGLPKLLEGCVHIFAAVIKARQTCA